MEALKQNVYTEKDYYALPEDVRAELIEGEFIYNLAAPSRIHQKFVRFLIHKIQTYIDYKGGSCEVYPAPFSVRISNDDTTVVEPDISVICDPNKLTDAGCDGAPDWIIEIASPSNFRNDYVRKLNLYKQARVREYWIVDPEEKNIIVYYLKNREYIVETYTFEDKIKVNIYDDLYIDISELK
ncbi:MAG: Uma2 family endonuclease [Clostridiales bacterium]|nr:Uma2 family endonuclease [Clostridiales bacterium]